MTNPSPSIVFHLDRQANGPPRGDPIIVRPPIRCGLLHYAKWILLTRSINHGKSPSTSILDLHPPRSQSLLKRGPLMRQFSAWLDNTSMSTTVDWMISVASLLTCKEGIESWRVTIPILLLRVEYWRNRPLIDLECLTGSV